MHNFPFQRLQADLAKLIAHTPPGQRLLNEPELAKQMGVSRATLREAMRTFETQGLMPSELRALSQRQIAALASALGIQTDVELQEIGGFLALHTRDAERLHKALREHDVWTDYRGKTLRLGPAPYVTDSQLRATADGFRA